MKLHDFMLDERLCGSEFQGPSWATWRVIARLWDGDADQLTEEQQAIARELLGCEQLPSGPPEEMFLGFGRRSGKTRFEAVAAVHAWAQDYREHLAPGEWATISIHATNKRQAATAFGYCEGIIRASRLLDSEAENMTSECIESKHRTRIEVFTANFRSARSYSMPLAIIDEASFLRDEYSANPDIELRRALLPGLATLRGRLLVASSLHRRTGLMWQQYQKHYGKAA